MTGRAFYPLLLACPPQGVLTRLARFQTVTVTAVAAGPTRLQISAGIMLTPRLINSGAMEQWKFEAVFGGAIRGKMQFDVVIDEQLLQRSQNW